MRRILLHAGTHKTGTTSIQAALAANRGQLIREGIAYPALDKEGINHSGLARRIAAAAPADLGSISGEIIRSAAQAPTLVLSSEEIYAFTGPTAEWSEFSRADYWTRREVWLCRLRDTLSVVGRPVVYLYFRRHDEYASSLYATKVLSGRFSGSFRDFRETVNQLFDYQRQADLFRRVFSNVEIAPFQSSVDIVARFCERVGIPLVEGGGARAKVGADPRLTVWLQRRRGTSELDDLRRRYARWEFDGSILPRGSFTLWESEAEREQFLSTRCTDPETAFFAGVDARGSGVGADEPEAMNILDADFERWSRTAGRRGLRRFFKTATAPLRLTK